MVEDLGGANALDLTGGRRSILSRNPLAWAAGVLATTAAAGLAAILVLVFAATLAVVLVLSAAVLASAAIAWRLGKRNAPHALATRSPTPLSASRIGHSWVAYGWDRQA